MARGDGNLHGCVVLHIENFSLINKKKAPLLLHGVNKTKMYIACISTYIPATNLPLVKFIHKSVGPIILSPSTKSCKKGSIQTQQLKPFPLWDYYQVQ